ncbi:MAG TPA: glucose-1-phosphate adenylyltransferase, partial [Enterococcus casseliflavus]|nr:glucose-1-phosphate adenylyltransferase [Enterococcus casseliflavus]
MRTNKMCAILGNLQRYQDLMPLTENRPLST